jgi:predicted RNA methylase
VTKPVEKSPWQTPEVGALTVSETPAPTPREIVERLRNGPLPLDSAFDRFLPDSLRGVSAEYWTPLCVAKRAAGWLQAVSARSVLDIGSGPGKFCVATAALTTGCHFTGVEQRARFVLAARELACRFELESRVTFIAGSLDEAARCEADAYYLYNPFGENLVDPSDKLDDEAELSRERYERDIARVEQLLQRAAEGHCVLTYNGFGGEMPSTYARVQVDTDLPYELCMWQKTRR